jgi:hypothetical protein
VAYRAACQKMFERYSGSTDPIEISFVGWTCALLPDALDDCLKDRAGQFERRDLSRTFFATRPDQPFVLGYYAISTPVTCSSRYTRFAS